MNTMITKLFIKPSQCNFFNTSFLIKSKDFCKIKLSEHNKEETQGPQTLKYSYIRAYKTSFINIKYFKVL